VLTKQSPTDPHLTLLEPPLRPQRTRLHFRVKGLLQTRASPSLHVILPAPVVFIGEGAFFTTAAHPPVFEGEGSPPDPRPTLLAPVSPRRVHFPNGAAVFPGIARHIVPMLFREGRYATAAHPPAFEGKVSPPDPHLTLLAPVSPLLVNSPSGVADSVREVVSFTTEGCLHKI